LHSDISGYNLRWLLRACRLPGIGAGFVLLQYAVWRQVVRTSLRCVWTRLHYRMVADRKRGGQRSILATRYYSQRINFENRVYKQLNKTLCTCSHADS
jgi:hypothetical protein